MTDAALSAMILVFALILFVTERVRHDLVALLALLACLATGLVAPRQALAGFADPAVIAVASVLVIGRALELSGIAAAATRALVPRHAPFVVQLTTLMLLGAFLSAFMNNIAALVVTMPLATDLTRRMKLPPGAALMPIAFATILGGMTTLIGTPANLILSSVREQELGEPFGFFSMTGVGVPVAVVGMLYLATVGWRLIPRRRGARLDARPWRVFELSVIQGMSASSMKGRLRRAGARIVRRFRDGQPVAEHTPPMAGDQLLLLSRADQSDVARRAGFASGDDAATGQEVTTRVVVGHGSILIGSGYDSVRTRSGGRVDVVAGGPRAARLGEPLAQIIVEAGDQLYLRGAPEAIAALLPRARLLEIDRFDPAPMERRGGLLTLLIFTICIGCAVFGLASPAIAFLAGAAMVAALRLIPPSDVYQAIDWSVIVLLAAMIPVGQSFEASGAAEIAAGWLADALAGAPLFWTIAALCGTTLLLSIFLNNVATAVVMGAIAIDLAGRLGVDPDLALLAVLIGASSDFLTPIGHQNNLLVMGPGGYLFSDYSRAGAPLAVLTVLVTAAVLSLAQL